MTRKSVTQRQLKREKRVAKSFAKRAKLNKTMRHADSTPDEKMAAQIALQKMGKDASYVRLRTRCLKTGRPRGVLKRFMVAGMTLRDLFNKGKLPGVQKASW